MKKQIKKMISGWIAVIVMLASAGSLVAHHSLSQFDTTTAVWVKGTIARIELVNPHTIIFVNQKGADGQIQRWAVEGPGVTQLSRMGMNKEAMKVGDFIEACGYVTQGVDSQRTVVTEPISTSLKASTLKSVSGRLMDAEMLVMPGGQKQKWSDYGQHLCLGPDYHDFHK
jgi:hypothetical protein